MKRILTVLLLTLLLASCASNATPEEVVVSTATVTQSSGLPTPLVETTQVPDVSASLSTFLEFWRQNDHASMYEMLTRVSKDAITFEAFNQQLVDFSVNLTLQDIEYTVLSTLIKPNSAQISYRVSYKTTLMDSLTRELTANFSMEDNIWRLQWDDGLMMPELRGGNKLLLNVSSPARGNIYDVNGEALVTETEVVSLGIAPVSIENGNYAATVSALSILTDKKQKDIYDLLEKYGYDSGYIPVGEALAQDVDDRQYQLVGLEGFIQNRYASRYYYDGGIAPHATGYVKPIYAEELIDFQRLGYRADDRVGLLDWKNGEKVICLVNGAWNFSWLPREGQLYPNYLNKMLKLRNRFIQPLIPYFSSGLNGLFKE